ncbi:MAG: ABC transporter permease subunit [Pyrobaculum sp.]
MTITLVASIPTAYAVARLGVSANFLTLFVVLVGLSRSIPPAVFMPATYEVLYRYGLVDSYLGISLAYQIYTVPLALWLLTAFSMELDPDLERAARVGGAGPVARFLRIYLPAVAPGVVAVALLSAAELYGEYLYASVLLSEEHQTVALLVGRLQVSEFRSERNVIGAASVVTTIPMVAVVFFAARSRKYLALGTGGRKGAA